ncbi:CBS domain-containing protein [Devosia honganensis]|uniref:CBS domain-containing protein n=1 Tax=Devosia honganensis TaxID=1610527 RepID=A0ABV7WWE2_9HYPH
MHVETILQTKGVAVHTLPETGTLADAVALLNAHNIGAVVIRSADGRVTGILSERDIVRQLGRTPSTTLGMVIGACMSRDLVSCERTTPIEDVMERMTNRRVRHMPVIEDGRLVGIVSIGDVVKQKIEQVEQEAEALREYISG